MMSQEQVVNVNDRLLDATFDLVVRGGPRAATVSAAASEAGLSRMTVYRKFGDRHALLGALLNRELGAILQNAAATGDDSPEGIAAIVVSTVEAINTHPLMAAVLQHEPEQLTEWITGRLGRTQRSAQATLRDLIASGQARAVVRSGDPDNPGDPGDPGDMALTLVLVAQAFVFGHRIGGSTSELHTLVKGYLS